MLLLSVSATAICIAAAIVGGTGLAIGLLLGIADKTLFVPTDETIEKIREVLPGNNCGGCGFAGCDALAEAIANGDAKPNACPVGGAEAAKAVSQIMGVETDFVRKTAFVKCKGTCDTSRYIYSYFGSNNCHEVALTPGRGPKACAYGCTGLGSCVQACPFDAIHIVRGAAEVDREKCKACGKCIDTCPHNLIELVPYDATYVVRCFSQERGKTVKDMCSAGCIGCGLCARNCEADAITLENNIAHIDQEKCIGCGKCAEKCPINVIIKLS